MPCYYMPMAPKLLEEAYLLISSSKDSWESVNLQINSREEVVLITLGTNWLLSWDVLASWGNSRCFQAYVVDSRYSSNIQSLNPAAVINNHLVNLHERIQLVIQSGNSGKCHVGRWPTKATTSNDGIKDWHTGRILVEQSVWLVLTRSHILSVGGRCRKSYRECHHLLPLHYILSW